jgi:hypothetical protein
MTNGLFVTPGPGRSEGPDVFAIPEDIRAFA